jgi:signal peptidase II
MEGIVIQTDNPASRDHSRLWSRLRKDSPFFIVAASVFALDQLTKYLVRANLRIGESVPDSGLVRIVHYTNTGAAFGMLQGQTLFLTATTLFGLLAIVLYYLYPPMDNGILRVALGLQLGGAVGNLSDRIRVGEVTDFIQWPHWPAFNVADSAICVGVATILIFLTLSDTIWREKKT